MTLHSWLARAERRLTDSGAADPGIDAEWMLADALQLSRSQLRMRREQVLTEKQLVQLEEWLSRREAGEPLQYVQGYAWFMGLRFFVDRRVLIPRQDTETLCEAALERLPQGARVLDLCTGSGALAVAIAHIRPDAQVSAADISLDALDVARENAASQGARIALYQGDLFDAVPDQVFDLIASNPPYIREDEMPLLQAEVRREPALALRAGEDGLVFYRRIAQTYMDHLVIGGRLLLEVGIHQADAVRRMFPGQRTETRRDLGGIERVVMITRMV
ncbi:peptide chain release factor N(5)-glutamine methyltransferase [Eubacteriales bacterium OttesenSCG-928-N13]|nr:peptide chain release factor N(5)-glutamine methyltransferase [Eubacteriales bacterium OttesenSCG-928-N13]